MIRAFLRTGLALAALGTAAAALVGPALFAGPRGEALLVAAPQPEAAVQAASLGASDCASLELLAADDAGPSAVLALRLSADEQLAIARVPAGDDSVLLVIFDAHGNLVPLTGARAAGELAAALSHDCAAPAAEEKTPGAI